MISEGPGAIQEGEAAHHKQEEGARRADRPHRPQKVPRVPRRLQGLEQPAAGGGRHIDARQGLAETGDAQGSQGGCCSGLMFQWFNTKYS